MLINYIGSFAGMETCPATGSPSPLLSDPRIQISDTAMSPIWLQMAIVAAISILSHRAGQKKTWQTWSSTSEIGIFN